MGAGSASAAPRAQSSPTGLDDALLLDLGVARVGEIVSGDGLRLADGRIARLACLEAAAPPTDAAPTDAEPGRRWPLAEGARRALTSFVGNRPVRLWAQNAEPDRHDRLAVHLQRPDDGAWAQEALLADGWARVRPAPDDDARARALLAVEQTARQARKGLWSTKIFAVRPAADPTALSRDYGLLTLAEGKPTAAQNRGGKIYLDFGADWRRDFTAVVTRDAARSLKREGVDPAALVGRSLRVRGWPDRHFGPQMEIAVAAQLEVLD